jgi:alkylation response protein AidB-like acyl-CoA dehydrogenase
VNASQDSASAEPTSEELQAYRLRVRAWLDTVEVPALTGDLETRFVRLRQWQRVLYAAGFMGVSWQQAWGGQGLTPLHQLVLNEELCRARAPQPIGLIGLDVVGPSIAKYGTVEQQALLPQLLAGDDIWCQGFSEPEAGSDLAAIQTTADLRGDHFVVSGQKTWTSWGHLADRCALLARGSEGLGRRGLLYLIVDLEAPGITRRPIRQMTGESEFCELFFDEVVVPVENLVGQVNQGWEIAMDTLSNERGSYALRRRAEISTAFDDAVDTLRACVADDLGSVPTRVLESVGGSTVALALLGARNRDTVRRMMRTPGPSPLDSVDKLVLTWTEQEVFRSLYELLGPSAMTNATTEWGLDAASITREYLYSRAASIYGGTEQIQRNIVAERLLGLPKAN